MTKSQLFFYILISLIGNHCYSQNIISSKEALKSYKKISASIEQSFPENEYATFSRESFSDIQLGKYLSLHFQRMDLLPFIENNYALKLHSYLHSGNWFRAIGFPKESIKSYKSLFEYYQANKNYIPTEQKQDFIALMSHAYSDQAGNYAKISNLDSASIMYKTNIKFTQPLNTIAYPASINEYGLFLYSTKKDLDSALIYFNKAFAITKEKFPNHTLIGSIRDNIADVNFDYGKYKDAKPLYKANFEFYQNAINELTKSKDIPRLISAGAQLLNTNLKLSQIDEAAKIFVQLENLFKKETNKEKIPLDSKLEFLQMKELLFVKQHNFEAAYATSIDAKRLADSLNAIVSESEIIWQSKLNNISINRYKANYELEKSQKESKIKEQQLKLWIVAITAISIIGFLTALFLRRRGHIIIAKSKQLIAEQDLMLTAIKNDQLQSEIKSKKRDLSDFAINLSQNQEWARTLSGKLKELRNTKGRERKKLFDDLEQDIKNKITFDKDTKEFYERLDKLSDTFYRQLMDKFPDLSKTEKQLCSLIRLKIESHEIATLQNITLSSLNTSRYRLRKKLNLTVNDNLDDFIQGL